MMLAGSVSGATSALIGALIMQRSGPLPPWGAVLALVVLVGFAIWIGYDLWRGKLKWPK